MNTTNTLDTKEQIQDFKLFSLWRCLKMELETGLKMSRNGSAYNEIKKLTNWKGSKKKIFTQYLACVDVIKWDQMREVKEYVGKDYFYSIKLTDYVEIV